MRKFTLLLALLALNVALYAQGVQATLTTGSPASQVVIKLKNASTTAVSGPLSSFSVGIRIPSQSSNPTLSLTGLNGTIPSGPVSNIAPFVNGGYAYYLVSVNYSGQTFPMAVNEEKDLLGLAFYGTGGSTTVIPSVEMVTFSTGGPNGPADQLQYYVSIGGDRTDYTNSFYATAGSVGLDNIGDPKIVGMNSVPLPVTWLSFTADKAGSNAVLNWATASEQNSAGFEVERSADGKAFSTIGFVGTKAAEGNSKEKLAYNFTDSKPLNGVNHYRLKQLGTDRNPSLSEVRQVTFNQATAVEIYPNPVNGLSVRVKGSNISNITVFNMAGQLVRVPVTYGAAESVLNASGLASGTYTLRVTADGNVSNHKLAVQH